MMRPANRHPLVILSAVVLLGGWLSPAKTHEVPMSHRQNAPSKTQATEQTTRTAIDNFNEAFNRHDADALAAFLTEDTVFEDTSPAPDGRRIEGKAAVVDFWRGCVRAQLRPPTSTPRKSSSVGNRAVVLWVYRKIRNGSAPGDLRGVDIFTVRDAQSEPPKLAYVKGSTVLTTG